MELTYETGHQPPSRYPAPSTLSAILPVPHGEPLSTPATDCSAYPVEPSLGHCRHQQMDWRSAQWGFHIWPAALTS